MSANIAPASTPAILEVKLHHRIGRLTLDATFTLTKPWSILFGPSGSGKTTLLRAIAGFIQPDTGRITRANTPLFDSQSNIAIPAHLRPIRSAAQTPRLFPHMSVQQNILYGSGQSAKPHDAANIATETMTLFRIQNLAHRKPADLSGGEKQRASVARAIVSAITFDGHETPLLLLDEPFSGLDATLRDELLPALHDSLKSHNIPVLFVTHDIGEAFQLNAEVLKLHEGSITEQGPAATVLASERTRLLTRLR